MLTRREAAAAIAAGALALGVGSAAPAGDVELRPLPPPKSSGGMPLIEALKLRRSTRAFSQRPLEQQVLSDLLWAADGVNRPSGDRTAPYWRHIMVIDIYAAMADEAESAPQPNRIACAAPYMRLPGPARPAQSRARAPPRAVACM